MPKLFGKKKGKKKGSKDTGSYTSFSQALMPPVVFTATPRIAGCPYEPIILRPLDHSSFATFACQGLVSDLPPCDTATSSRNFQPQDGIAVPDVDDEDEDEFDGDYDCHCPVLHTFSTVGLGPLGPMLGPPNEFRDNFSDDEGQQSFDDERISPAARSTLPVEADISMENSINESLRASRTSDSRRSHSMGRELSPDMEEISQLGRLSRTSARSRAKDSLPHTREILRDSSQRPLKEMINSQIIAPMHGSSRPSSPVPHASSSSEYRPVQEPFLSARSQEGSILKMSHTSSLINRSQEVPVFKVTSTNFTDQILESKDETVRALRNQILTLEEENHHMKDYIEIQQFEITNLRRMREDMEASASSRVRSGEAREEIEKLKSLVHRLNAELDHYHKKFRKLTPSEVNEVTSLPIKGPKPSWLVNTRYLSPLLVAYDDQLQEKQVVIETYENKLAHFQQNVDEILKENQRLHIRLEQTDAVGPISMTEWRQFQEQCKLVLEENQLLMEQLDIQQNKEKELHKTFLQETSKLLQKGNVAETKATQLQLEAEELRSRFNNLKQKYDEAIVDSRSKIDAEEHYEAISSAKQSAQEDRQKHFKELDDMSTKIQAAELGKENMARELEKANVMIQQLETNIKNKLKSEKKYKKEIESLKMTVNDLEMLSAKVRVYLANVLKTAEVTSKERDSLAHSVEEQEKAKVTILKKLVSETSGMAKINEKIKAYNLKKKEKLNQMASRLKEQDNDFNMQRQEYEREIKHLRQILRDKEEMVNVISAEKKEVLEDLETMWQAASKDNQGMKETIRQTNRKLQDHVSLRTRLLDEPEPSNELDQMLKQCACD